MIRSMTAYGQGHAESEQNAVNIEIRSVNNRFLDLNLRLPEDLRFAENNLRKIVGKFVKRGKLEVKVNYALNTCNNNNHAIDMQALAELAGELQQARALIPDLQAPAWADLPRQLHVNSFIDQENWLLLCENACEQAFQEFDANRQREGQRLATDMLSIADECQTIVQQVQANLPEILKQFQDKITQRLQEALNNASPEGYIAISGNELSARIAQETSLFGMRVDIAEEITRLNSHIEELKQILNNEQTVGKNNASNGKRLDFLFQEMNREANTLGSKSANLTTTQAAINLKLLIEQLREQAQNIE